MRHNNLVSAFYLSGAILKERERWGNQGTAF